MTSPAVPDLAQDPAAFNLAAWVLAAGAQQSDKMAMQILRLSGAERWSYGRLIAAVRGAGTLMLEQGLEPGDRVLLRLGNGPEFPVAFLGAIAAGLVPVPTSSQLTAPEITALAARLHPALVITASGIACPDGDWPVLGAGQLRDADSRTPCAWHFGPAGRAAYIVFTSGTTAGPRGVVHAHRVILGRAPMHAGWEGLTSTDRLLHAGAFNWTYTLGVGLMDTWTVGASALIPAAGIAPPQLPLLLRRFDATIFAAAPGVIRQMLRADLPPLPRLRHGLSAGESLPPDLRTAWRAATGTDLHESLGMSECSTFISGSPSRPAPDGHIGFAQPGRRIAVLGPDGPVLPGSGGELAIHRSDPGLMLHYLDDPVATGARFRGEWFLTGDQVCQSADGALRYLGRNDDQMNPGGYRVSPQEVEAELAGLPGAMDFAVAEVEVKAGAKVICGFYTAPADLDGGALSAYASEKLARYKQPRLWQRVGELPRNANGKLNRRALPALWRSE